MPGTSTIPRMNSDLAAAGPGLVDNADLLRSILAASGDCIKILDLDGRLQFMSEGGLRVMEVEDFSKLKGCPWPDLWADQGNVEAKRAVAAARQGGSARFQAEANTAKGNPRYWDVQVSSIAGPGGKPSYILSISRDITAEWRALAELRAAAEQQALLSGELQHRIKNTLAMVGAIANQTLRGDDLPAAAKAFSGRLMTLSHAHDILTQTSWTSAPIRSVVEGAIGPHRTDRNQINVSGPDLLLQPKQALALTIAMHELSTNAVKYGALSNSGRVDVSWSTEPDSAAPVFHFRWTESGGPLVSEPPADKKGFGSRLIERMLANDFDGQATLHYHPQGVVCELIAPMTALAPQVSASV